MANELVHVSVGTSLTQAEYEGVTAHQFNSQAAGDVLYASSATQLTRLAKGTDGDFLASGTPPVWVTHGATRTNSYIYFGVPGFVDSQALTADRLAISIMYIPRPFTVNQMNIHVSGAGGVGTVIRLVIYNVGVNFAGGSLVLNAGTVAADGATGVKAITGLNTTLAAGFYFVGAISDGTPTIRTIESEDISSPLGMSTSTLQTSTLTLYREAQDIDALPDPFGASDGDWTVGYIIGLYDTT